MHHPTESLSPQFDIFSSPMLCATLEHAIVIYRAIYPLFNLILADTTSKAAGKMVDGVTGAATAVSDGAKSGIKVVAEGGKSAGERSDLEILYFFYI